MGNKEETDTSTRVAALSANRRYFWIILPSLRFSMFHASETHAAVGVIVHRLL